VNTLGPRHAHFSTRENEGGGSGFSQAHDYGCEASRVEFGVAAAEGDLFEVEADAEIGCGGNILDSDKDCAAEAVGCFDY